MSKRSGDWNLATDVGMSFFPAIVNTSSSLGQDRGFRDRYSLDIDLEINSIFAERASVKFYSQTTEQSQMTTKEKQTLIASLAQPAWQLKSQIITLIKR